jgi:transposase-like protein
VCGAEWGQPSAERVNQRNGYRHRELDTRVGTVDVAVPKLRQGSYLPEWLLERRKRAESALISVMVTCYLLGVSTRRMDKLVATLGITSLSKSQVSRMAAELDEQETGWWDEHGDLALREMANCDRKHVGVTDRVLPAVGVSGLWGKCPPKSPEQRPICVT